MPGMRQMRQMRQAGEADEAGPPHQMRQPAASGKRQMRQRARLIWQMRQRQIRQMRRRQMRRGSGR